MTTEHAFHTEQLNEREWPEYMAAQDAEEYRHDEDESDDRD